MKKDPETKASPAPLCIDTTLLRFGNNLRGIPQVLFLILDILSEPAFRGRVRFLAYRDVAEDYLIPRGLPPEHIVIVPPVPLLGRWERFHTLFSTWRYRKATRGAIALVHSEPRTMTRLDISQIVVWYDFLQIEGRWKPWKKPTRYLPTYYKYRLAMRKARGITISEHTKREALRFFPGTNPDKLTPLWLGVRRQMKPRRPPRTESLSTPLRCMYVGSLEERKNVHNMLGHLGEIFGDVPFRLELAGKSTPAEKTRAEGILATAGQLANVALRGLLSDGELLALAERCDITLFPSLGEGFGLPVAEAMAHGHIVFAFNNTSIPEVGGDAIVLAENNGFAEWGAALRRLIADPEACAALRRRAVERAEIFSEEGMRARYREYFRDVLAHAEGS